MESTILLNQHINLLVFLYPVHPSPMWKQLWLMMPFSTGTRLERVGIAGPELELSLGQSAGSGCCAPLQKQVTKRIGRGSSVAALMPKSVLSCRKNRLTALGGKCSAYLTPMGWPGIYSKCFSQLDDGKDSLLLDGGFSTLIAVR